MPADTSVAIGLDVTALAKSKTFQKLLPLLLSSQKEVKRGLEEFKVACKLDPLVAIKSIVVGLDATQSDGAVFINIPNFTPVKLQTCMQQIAKAEGKGAKTGSLKLRTVEHVTELSNHGRSLFFGWIGSDVLVMVPKHLESREALRAWMNGGFDKGPLSKLMTSVNTSSAVFLASAAGKKIDASYTIKKGFGWLTLEKGNLAVKLDADMGSEASAKAVVAETNADLVQARENLPLPQLADMVRNVSITQSGTEMVITGTAVEKDFAEIVATVVASM